MPPASANKVATWQNTPPIVTPGTNESVYEELTELIIRVSDYLTKANEAMRRKVRVAMGVEVLELMGERAKRLEAEAEQRGIEQGMEQGIAQGVEQGTADMAAMLRERGVDPALLDEVQELVKSSDKHAE